MMGSYLVTPAAMLPGCFTRNGILRADSKALRGHPEFPLPTRPWWVRENPWSEENVTKVSFV